VNNWHREMNEVFNLDFEVFGSEGDVTDRKSNAFAKHDRLIASIDTLKRKARIKRLLEEAPQWDLVVFDEAHHLTAYRNGGKVKKTENYKLAEALKDHSARPDAALGDAAPGRSLPLLDARAAADSTLFKSPGGHGRQRHRLNSVCSGAPRPTPADPTAARSSRGAGSTPSRS
jgi:SNF2 family DNA or RNA helicase